MANEALRNGKMPGIAVSLGGVKSVWNDNKRAIEEARNMTVDTKADQDDAIPVAFPNTFGVILKTLIINLGIAVYTK